MNVEQHTMRALLSVSDRTGLVDLGRALAARAYDLVSTGGTADCLADAGLAVRRISDVTGFPELMDGRVKTLHPAVYGAILARRDRPTDIDEASRHGIGLIDVVVVNLYPFVRAAADRSVSFPGLLEQIDVGGPALIRAAAKNFRDVLVVVNPADYLPLLRQLDRPEGPSADFRLELARKAFDHTAAYDSAIAVAFRQVTALKDDFAYAPAAPDAPPPALSLLLRKLGNLRYGENPHQHAAWYGADRVDGLSGATVLQGKELSFTNLLDLDAALRIVSEFEEPAAAIVKHTNPCGAAIGSSITEAYARARDADSAAAFGGIVGLNRPIDEEAADLVASSFIEAVVAPGVDDLARAVLAARPSMRVLVVDPGTFARARAPEGLEVRSILGAVLVQQQDGLDEGRARWGGRASAPRVVTRRAPTEHEWDALRFAWRVCAHVKSNAVVFADAHATLAIGAGQVSRVDAVRVAVMKASLAARGAAGARPLAGSVAASDAFFPFRDGLDAAAAAGATAIVQPGGSKRDDEVIAAADEHSLAMVFTGRRHFRH